MKNWGHKRIYSPADKLAYCKQYLKAIEVCPYITRKDWAEGKGLSVSSFGRWMRLYQQKQANKGKRMVLS